jgi:hypothetical protein
MQALTLSSLVWPEPISPFFSSGGPLAGLNEDAVFTAAIMIVLGLVDLAVCRPFLSPKSRYFALHATANAVSTIAAFPDLWRVLVDPLNAFRGPTSTMVANSAVLSIHLYHCLFFRLRPDEIFHHALFVTILCGLAIPFKHVGGASNNLGCFFLSGLPGGVNYVLLVLVKEGRMASLNQKAWDAWINTWIRAPPMAVYAFLQYQSWLYGRSMDVVSPAAQIIIISVIAWLHFFNGQYYAAMAVANHAASAASAAALRGKKDDSGVGNNAG